MKNVIVLLSIVFSSLQLYVQDTIELNNKRLKEHTLILFISLFYFSTHTAYSFQEEIVNNTSISIASKLEAIQESKPTIKKVDLLFNLADSYFSQMEFEAQSSTLEEALLLSIELNNTEKQIEACILLANLRIEDLHTQKRKKEALNEALKLIVNTKNYSLIARVKELQIELNDTLLPQERLKAHKDLLQKKKDKNLPAIELAFSELRIGEKYFKLTKLDSTLLFFNKALARLDTVDNDPKTSLLRGLIYIELAEYYGFKDGEVKEIDKATYFYKAADSIFIYLNNIPFEIENTASYSQFLSIIGNNNDALIELNKAYKKSDKYVISKILGNMALLSYKNGDYNESLDFYLKALPKFEAINDYEGAAVCGLSIAIVYSRLKEFPKAIPYIEKVQLYADQVNDPALSKLVYETRGRLYLGMEQYKAYIDELEKIISVDTQLKNYSHIAGQKIAIAQTYIKIGNVEEAKRYNDEALAYYTNHPDQSAAVSLYDNFYTIYKLKEDYEQALQNLETKIAYQDSIKSQEIADRLNEERANIKVIDAQESVNRTEKEKKLLESEAALLTTRNRLYVILGILATAFFLLLFLNSRSKNKVEKQLAVEKLRTKISADLHDDVGSVLTGLAMQSEVLGKNAPENITPKLERISELSRSAMLQMRDAVWVMDARKDNWQSLIDRINEFASEHLGAKELKYNLNHTNTTHEEEIESVTRQHLYLVTKEAVANILKHSNADTVIINLSKNKNEIELHIKDNGTTNKKGTAGIGISNMKQRIEELKGNLEISMNDGYQITVKIPA